jgi:hypothetical protein
MTRTPHTPLVRRGNGKAVHYATLNSKSEPIGTWCATDVLAGGTKDSGLTVFVDATEATCKTCLRAAAEVQHVETAPSKDADASKGKPATATKGKSSKAVSEPAAGPLKPSAAKAAAREVSTTGAVKRIAPQLVGYTEGRDVDAALVAAFKAGVVDNQQAVWIPVTVETCERLLTFGRAVLDDTDTTAGARRTAAAMIRRVKSYTLPEAGKATA